MDESGGSGQPRSGSDEAPEVRGLGLMRGRITRLRGIAAERVKVPHVGWNALDLSARPSRLLQGLAPGAQVYFTHSYAAPVTDDCIAATTHADPFASAVERGKNSRGPRLNSKRRERD